MPSPSTPGDPTQIANIVITWSGVVLAAFALLLTMFSVLFFAAGFFGLRELNSIRRAGIRAREQAERQADRARDLMAEWQDGIRTVDERLSRLVEVSYLFNQGEVAYRDGLYERAVEYLGRAVALDPKNERVRYRLGRSLTNLGDEAAAAHHFREAQLMSGPPGAALRGLALVYRYSDPNQALRYAREAVDIGPDEARNWNCLGLMLRDSGDFAAAKNAHESAAQIDRESVTTPFYLAMLEANANAFQRAINDSGMAMVRLEDQERLGKVKPLWAALIRWADAILRGDYPQADRWTRILRDKCLSRRRALEVHGHMVFLLRSLDRDEFLERFAGPVERRWLTTADRA